jgi:hypothetical protein
VTDFTLDPSTGLPVLPDGQFWRVDHFVPAYHYSGETGPTHVVQLREVVPATTERVPRKHFKKLTKVVPVAETSKVLGSSVVGTYHHFPSVEERNYSTLAAFKKAAADTEKKIFAALEALPNGKRGSRADRGYYGYTSWREVVVSDNTVNEASILASAVKVLEENEAKRIAELEAAEKKAKAEREREAHEAKANYFVGDYPPKMLLHD